MNEPIKKKKRRRYIPPHPGDKRTLLLSASPRYRVILEHLLLYKYCTIDHVWALLNIEHQAGRLAGGRGRKTDTKVLNVSAVYRNLRYLWEHDLVCRRKPVAGIMTTGDVKDIYHLSPKGAKLLGKYLGVPYGDFSYPKLPRRDKPHEGNPTGQYDFLKHRLAVTDMLVFFATYCSEQKRYDLISFQHDIAQKIYFQREGEGRFFVCPDGFMLIYDHQEKLLIPLFIEVDRGTERVTRWKDKLLPYIQFFKDPMYSVFLEDHIDKLPEGLEYNKEKLLKRQIVLCSMPSPGRQKSLYEATRDTINQGQGSGRFQFIQHSSFDLVQREEKTAKDSKKTYSTLVLNPESTAILATPIWQLGTQEGQMYTLLPLD